MKWSKIVIMLLPLSVLLPIAALPDDGKTQTIDTAKGSRWAKVDVTQFCGRTVGELLDTLGNDYNDCFCGGEPLYGVGCTFVYNDGSIELGPYTYKYIHTNKHDYRYYHPATQNSPWNLDEFRKETIDYIALGIGPSQSVLILRVGTGGNRHKGFGLDYAGYIGSTIDSLLSDIGYPVMSSLAYTGLSGYFKCLFEYRNHVTIEADLETPIPVPADVTNRNLVTDIVLRQKLGHLRIFIGCPGQGK